MCSVINIAKYLKRCVAVPVNLFFVIVSSWFAMFKNVEHSLEPGELPGVSQGSKLCATFLNLAKRIKTARSQSEDCTELVFSF